jgi:preprotein translocase subunit SecG
MKKLKLLLKVYTFINFKIILMSIFMILTILFGVKYTNDSIDYTSNINRKIKDNSLTTISLSENMNQFNLVDNLILSKSLKGENITNNMDIYISYVDSFMLNKYEYKRVDSLLQIKKRLLYNIYLSKKKSDILDIDDFKTTEIVPVYVEREEYKVKKRGIFKKSKVDTVIKRDTIYKTVSKIDGSEFQRKSQELKKMEDFEMQEAIYYNNSLSYQIRHLLNFKISTINSRNIKYQNDLSRDLEGRFLKYVTVMFSLMFVFLLTGLLLYIDIRKKSKSDERRKNFISLMLKNR